MQFRKDKERLQTYPQPRALEILHGISEQQSSYDELCPSQFPYTTTKQYPQDENLSNWEPGEVSETLQPKNINDSKFKTLMKYHYDVVRSRRQMSHAKRRTDHFGQNLTEVEAKRDCEEHKPKIRCAINLLNTFFKEQNIIQRYSINESRNKGTIQPKATGKQPANCGLAIRKIKKELLNGLQHRKAGSKQEKFGMVLRHKKNKVYTEIVIDLPFQTKKQNAKENPLSRHVRFSSLNPSQRRRDYSLHNSLEKPYNAFYSPKMEKIAQFKILKNLLSSQKM